MGVSKEIHANIRQLQEMYMADIDMSGGTFHEFCERQPKNKLDVTVNNFGNLYKAFLNGKRIWEDELFKILGINSTTPFRLERHLFEFEKKNKSTYKVVFSEIDVT